MSEESNEVQSTEVPVEAEVEAEQPNEASDVDPHKHPLDMLEALLSQKDRSPAQLSAEDFKIPMNTVIGVLMQIHNCVVADTGIKLAGLLLEAIREDFKPDDSMTLADLIEAYNAFKTTSSEELEELIGAPPSLAGLVPPASLLWHVLKAVQMGHGDTRVMRCHYQVSLVEHAHDLVVRESKFVKILTELEANDDADVDKYPALAAYEPCGDAILDLLYSIIAEQADMLDDAALVCMADKGAAIVAAHLKAAKVADKMLRQDDVEALQTSVEKLAELTKKIVGKASSEVAEESGVAIATRPGTDAEIAAEDVAADADQAAEAAEDEVANSTEVTEVADEEAPPTDA
jgi:hypothetical protein